MIAFIDVIALSHILFSTMDSSILYKLQEELLYALYYDRLATIICIYQDEFVVLWLEKPEGYFIEDNPEEFQ